MFNQCDAYKPYRFTKWIIHKQNVSEIFCAKEKCEIDYYKI